MDLLLPLFFPTTTRVKTIMQICSMNSLSLKLRCPGFAGACVSVSVCVCVGMGGGRGESNYDVTASEV